MFTVALTDAINPDRQLATGNLLTAIGVGAWDPQMSDAIKFTFEAFKQIQTDYASRGLEPPSLDDIRSMVNVTGHSLGGSLAEMTAKFFGLSGANIDGPGVQAPTLQTQYADLQGQVKEVFPELKADYALDKSQFGAYAYTVVGVAGTHLGGIEVEKAPMAVAAEASMFGAAGSAVTNFVPGMLLSAATASGTALYHPSGTILVDAETAAGVAASGALPSSPFDMLHLGQVMPSITRSSTLNGMQLSADARITQDNVAGGLSPTGVSLDGGSQHRGMFDVTAYRDSETGRIVEVYRSVNASGEFTGAVIKKEYVVDEGGRVGAVDGDGNVKFVAVDGSNDVAAVVTLTPDGQLSLQSNRGEASFLGSVPPEAAQQLRDGKGDLFNTGIGQSEVGKTFGGAGVHETSAAVSTVVPVEAAQIATTVGSTQTSPPTPAIEATLGGSDTHFLHHTATVVDEAGAGAAVIATSDPFEVSQVTTNSVSTPATLATSVVSVAVPVAEGNTNDTPMWLQTLKNSTNEGTKEFAALFSDPDYARTFDQINRSPTLQQDIIDFATGTGRFEGRGPGNFSNVGVDTNAAGYFTADNQNTVREGTNRLQGKSGDGAAVLAHEIQHAYNRADVNPPKGDPDPNFPTVNSPKIIWNNLLDEAEGQLRQYRIAKEIFDSQKLDPTQNPPLLNMGGAILPGEEKSARAIQIEQWLDDGAELYRHGLVPSPDYLARANLAVDIGNNEQPSLGSTNYVDYYANNGKPTAGDDTRMQHVEVTGIENGTVTVVFSGVGDEARLVRLTQPVDAGAEGPWNAEICRRIPVSGTSNPAPSTATGEQGFEVERTVSSDGKGNTTVVEHSATTGTTDGSDAHFAHYPPPDTTGTGTDTTPVAHREVEVGDTTYTLNTNGTLDRTIPGGLVESRDDTGAGIIFDRDGNTVAVLQPGDRVGLTDDGRIAVSDNNGHGVDRATDDAPAGTFATVTPAVTTDLTPDGSDAHLGHYPPPDTGASTGTDTGTTGTATTTPAGDTGTTSLPLPPGTGSTDNGSTTNPTVAIVDTDASAPKTIATTGNPTPPPIDTGAPDGSDAHFNNHPPTLDVAGLTADLGFANTLISGLKNWGSQNDLGHLSTLVSLYNQGTSLADVGGSQGPLGDLGGFGAGLGVVIALKGGNPIAVASSGASAINALTHTEVIPVINALNLVNAIQSGNPISIASSAVAFIPGYGPLLSIGISLIGSLFGSHSPPPPPDGVVHYTWDDSGAITIHTDSNVSGGGDTAHGTAGNILGMLQSVVDHKNDQNHAQGLGSADNLALDPTRLPKVGFTAGMSWIEVTHPDGSTTKETIDPSQLGQRLLQVAVANDAVVPAWQVQTMQAHHQAQQQEARIAAQQSAQEHAQEAANASAVEIDGHGPSTAAAPSNTNTAQDIDGHAPAANTSSQGASSHGPDTSAQGVAGKAAESADHKSQTYDALVVHLGNPTAQAHISALATSQAQAPDGLGSDNSSTANTAQGATQSPSGEVLRDIDGDGYFESTQWVDAMDANGDAQGMLVLDANHNGTVDTADILHLGGNSLDRNSMAWLDANGDGKLDASDPAFAAIKLWVDVNHNGRMDTGESTGLQSIQLTSIDLHAGTLNYADGQSDTLSTTTLTADTEGVKLDSIKVVGADGKLKELDAGELIVHEHYDGKTRTVSYELQAKVTGDWEKTAEAAAHRHGGGNVAGAPTQTSATGASSVGAVVGKTNVTTATTMDAGDKRITSDAPATTSTTSTAPKPSTITLNAGDARITSSAPQPKPIVFVPAGAREGWITEDGKALLQLPQDGLFSAGGLGALGAVALGAVQQTAFAQVEPGGAGFVWQSASADTTATAAATTTTSSLSNAGSSVAPATGTTIIHLEDFGVVRQLHLGVPHAAAQPLPAVQGLYLGEGTGPGPYLQPANLGEPSIPRPYLHPRVSAQPVEDATQQPTPGTLYIAPRNRPTSTPDSDTTQPTDTGSTSTAPTDSTTTTPSTPTTSTAPPSAPTTTPQAPIDTTPTAPTLNSATTGDDHLSDPQEDTALHVSVATLLANDSNATGIAQVGNAEHGTVVLQGGEVVFTPEANYHGPASFAYVVTGQDGGHAVGVASFTIGAVNDVPVAHGETVNASEDVAATITQATLLSNDTDVDTATDAQTLRVSAVGHATHGTVNILGNGSITFTPDANFHGTATFDYVVNDGNGGTSTATATVQVAAVNDVPVALGESITSSEDTTLLLTQAALLANDTDADVATDGQVLTISAVSNATHGTVSILGNGQVQFVPVANYSGTATFDYVVSDGHGGTATATATVLVGSTDDAPVAAGETVASQEDQTVTLTAAALLANDTDVDNTAAELSISRVAAGTGGTVTLNASGNVVFTPTANFSGTASFTYWVKDPAGLESNAATVTLNVAPVNDAPNAQGESVSGASEDAVFNIGKGILLGNDGDVEDANSALSLAWVGNATNGTVSLDGSGDVVFTPAANFNGTATFDYQVRDSAGAVSPTVTAQIPVAAVNDNPVAADESFTMYTNTAASPSVVNIGYNQLVANDTDIDNPLSDLTVSGVRNASNGTVTIVGGQVQFTPTQDFNGTASFEYQVNDQHGGTAWATAFVSVAPPPNQYASINVTYANFYPTGSTPAGAFDIGDVRWTIVDDGNTSLASVTYLGGTYHVFGDPGPATSSIPWNIFTTTQTSWYIDIPRSSALDAFDTTWRVVDDRGLQNIWHFGYTVGSGVRSSMDFSGWAPPVVLGLDGNAPHYIETSQSNVRFDLNGDGVADQVAWAAPGSGVLGIDLNGDHQISNANEFTFTQYTPGAKTDLEGLRAFDTNHNGVLDAADARWGQFGVWEDKNRDGQTQEGEYQSLDQLGIASIKLGSDQGTHAPVHVPSTAGDGHLSGVAVVGESSYTRTDGRTGVVHDAMFAFDADRELAEVRRMALQFNQFCNTVQSDYAPLGFVPIAADDHVMALPWVDGAGAHTGARHEDVFA